MFFSGFLILDRSKWRILLRANWMRQPCCKNQIKKAIVAQIRIKKRLQLQKCKRQWFSSALVCQLLLVDLKSKWVDITFPPSSWCWYKSDPDLIQISSSWLVLDTNLIKIWSRSETNLIQTWSSWFWCRYTSHPGSFSVDFASWCYESVLFTLWPLQTHSF